MDLRSYYKRVRDVEAQLPDGHLVVVSQATPEGGKEGVRTEVSRGLAAKLIAEGRARVATEDESRQFYESNRAAKEQYDQEEAAKRVQVMVLPSNEFRKPKERS